MPFGLLSLPPLPLSRGRQGKLVMSENEASAKPKFLKPILIVLTDLLVVAVAVAVTVIVDVGVPGL